MASIPTNVILIHTGTNASIPSGWTRETSLDGVFPKGWGDSVAPNQTGGATTHTHTSPTHSHSIAAHTHSASFNSAGVEGGDKTIEGGGSNASGECGHTHAGTSGAANGSTSSDSITYGSVSNDPPYRKVIFIKANPGAQLATDIVALWGESDTAPSNWSKVTELDGRYLKGAGTGADADLATDNGSSTNVHSISHTHSTANHTHASANAAVNSSSWRSTQNGSGGGGAGVNHTEAFSLDAATLTASTSVDLTTSETVEPAYRRLHAIKKGATGLKEKGIIGLWLGSTASIPGGWSLYTDMKDKHIKIGDPTTSATGGSNTHTHAAQGHTHSGGSHSHTTTHSTASQNLTGIGATAGYLLSHNHTVNSIGATSADWSSANTTADSSSNEPEYRTVAFIRFDKEKLGASILSLLMDAE